MVNPHNRLESEVAHILFMDLVAYSLLPMEEQARRWKELRDVVRDTHEFQRANDRKELISLDTGDGLALVFFRDPTSPVQCAVELAMSLQAHPNLPLRMGIHSGPVTRVRDIHEQENVSGSGINMAQRVMDCGEAGHILVSKSSAEMIREYESWGASLYDLGECEVKHDVCLHLFNFYVNGIGNLAAPHKSGVPAAQTHAGALPAASHSAMSVGSSETAGDISAEKEEPTGGAVPLDSRYYIERRTDGQFKTAVARGDSIVLVKGPRQIGKTSLLARGLKRAREAGVKVVLTDLQKFTAAQIETAETLFFVLADSIADQLDLDLAIGAFWKPERGWNVNFERFLRREVLGKLSSPLVWALDEVDRLFICPYGSEVFGLFRSWHNERSLDPDGHWSRLTLAMAYATEAHLFITDLNQSPFNVGTRLTLEDFSLAEVEELDQRFGGLLHGTEELEQFYALLGGHPYLVHRGLACLLTQRLDFTYLETHADDDSGPFSDHLRRLLFALEQDSQLTDVVRGLLREEGVMNTDTFYRLRSAGLVAGDSPSTTRLRCGLYARYLSRRLL